MKQWRTENWVTTPRNWNTRKNWGHTAEAENCCFPFPSFSLSLTFFSFFNLPHTHKHNSEPLWELKRRKTSNSKELRSWEGKIERENGNKERMKKKLLFFNSCEAILLRTTKSTTEMKENKKREKLETEKKWW